MSKAPTIKQIRCYICGKELDGSVTIDHILPDKFLKNFGNQPKLPVHYECNNLKSKEDQWFMQEIKFRCCLNETAGKEFVQFIEKAQLENPTKEHRTDIPLRNYKLAKTILKDIRENGKVLVRDEELYELQISEENGLRMDNYLKKLCEGLFIYQYQNTDPKLFLFSLIPIYKGGLGGKVDKQIEGIKQLLVFRDFYMEYGEKVVFCGAKLTDNTDRGFVAIEFYRQLLAVAYF